MFKNNLQNRFSYSLLFIVSLFVVSCASSLVETNEILVKTPSEYKQAVKNVKAGQTIVLANGTWNNFEITFKAQGTENAPVTLKAQDKGKVILTGQSNLRLAGEYLVVEGLVFKDGYTPTSEVVSFQINKKEMANHSRVSEIVIDNFSNPDRFESDYWVGIYGRHNRFDHNHLEGKRNKGVTVAVRLNTEASQENHHRIDHNYFGPRPIFGSNGGETLRIGTSHHSLTNSYTLVENNYFDRCDGEVEIISVKSGKNHIRNNVFFESRGTLTLRHGNGNVIENNVFFGNGVDHTGGIRVINRDQIVRNNYLEGLTGYRFGSGFTVMNGVPNSPINRYHQVVNAQITNNTFVNVEHIHLAAGSDAERSAAPQNSIMSNNLIVNESGKNAFSIFDDISGIKFEQNIVDGTPSPEIKQGFTKDSVKIKRNKLGLYEAVDSKFKNVGAHGLQVLNKADTGPSWYAKVEPIVAFDSGNVIKTTDKAGELFSAVTSAKSGDVIELADGTYTVTKMFSLDKTLTFKAKNNGKALIKFERSSLFEIKNGGSLKLVGLTFDGVDSPDSSGNILARTAKWGMYINYRFVADNIKVQNLDINHSFHFFDAGSRSFASEINITNSTFINVTGDIFRLNKETDDLGIYNAEYLRLNGNTFTDVGGALVKLYRGGRDESTFGPHIYMQNNQLENVGHDKRNKSKSALVLHGVQVTDVVNNVFKNTAGVNVEHTVGEPVTNISHNQFDASPVPKVVELIVKGEHTATLINNTSSK
ncbi:chondroitinase-B domain-containing protein [Algibacillus agarilyticus]|uniref:chondroitinase-B domain-containing protein n=1 Tax=Algibacillus agarilyticus TaxID=2234133 RepID=UPI000DCFF748|nr:chondroitinase-B domain-containing protein [Algibacillus agarilyticus]